VIAAAAALTGSSGVRPGQAWRGQTTPEADAEADPVAESQTVPGTAESAGQGSPSARDGGTVVVYSGRGQDLIEPLFTKFQEETGIRAEVRYAGTAELAATLLEEQGNSPADLFFSQDAGALGLIAGEGLLETLASTQLDRVAPRFRSAEGFWVGISGRARVLVYNTELLGPTDLPASVLDLVDPVWRGRIGWAPENASFQSFVTALRLLRGEEQARSWLEGMVANDVQNYGDSNAAIVRAVGAEEIAAGLVNHYYLYAVKKEEGEAFPIANHSFAAGDPGSLVNVAGVGLLKTSANSAEAARLIDYLLSDEGQTYFAEETTEYPLVAGIAPPADLVPIEEIGSPALDLGALADLRGTLSLLAEVGVL